VPLVSSRFRSKIRGLELTGCRWLTSVILATQEAEIRRIAVGSHPGQIVLQDPISKKPITKIGLVE
jgi:hypothetical protein